MSNAVVIGNTAYPLDIAASVYAAQVAGVVITVIAIGAVLYMVHHKRKAVAK
jgi:hypothetical protein